MSTDKCGKQCDNHTSAQNYIDNIQKVEMASANDTYYIGDYGNYLRSSNKDWIFYPKANKDNFSHNELIIIARTIESITENPNV